MNFPFILLRTSICSTHLHIYTPFFVNIMLAYSCKNDLYSSFTNNWVYVIDIQKLATPKLTIKCI